MEHKIQNMIENKVEYMLNLIDRGKMVPNEIKIKASVTAKDTIT